MIKKIKNFAFKYQLWQAKEKIIVGVSGGSDSRCLLSILVFLSKQYNWQLIVAHVNYGLRGKSSDIDERFVIRIAEKYKLKTKILKIAKGEKMTEAEMRKIRYDFFEKLRKENKFNLIAVAHNSNDQVETILMRLLRGSGLQGLKAMLPKNEKIIRPLLNTSRREILRYLQDKKMSHRIDESNQDLKYLRNKVRHELIPYLEKNYNKSLQKTLRDATVGIGEDYDFIVEKAKEHLTEYEEVFKVGKFLKLHPSMQRQVLRLLIEKTKTNLRDIESGHIEEILKIIKSKKSKKQEMILKGLRVERCGDLLKFWQL